MVQTRRLEGQMQLSELRPCAQCDGPLINPKEGAMQWYVLRSSMAMIQPVAANRVLGLTQFFQGSIKLAEVFEGSKPVMILGDMDARMQDEIHICFSCWTSDAMDAVRRLFEKESKRRNEELEKSCLCVPGCSVNGECPAHGDGGHLPELVR